MTAFLRIVHGLIAATSIASAVGLYYGAILRTYGLGLYLAVGALLPEGIVVTLNKGNCPFGHLSRRFGDNKPFFEIFLPRRIAKQMFRVNFVAVLIGGALLLIRLSA